MECTSFLGIWRGLFRSGKKAEQLATSPSNHIPFNLGAASVVLASAWEDCEEEIALSPQFQKEPSTLQEFLEFLLQHHKKIDKKIHEFLLQLPRVLVCHAVELDAQNKKWKVVSTKAACMPINTRRVPFGKGGWLLSINTGKK